MISEMHDELVIGVDIGGTRTKAGLVNMRTGEMLHVFIMPTETKQSVLFLNQLQTIVETCIVVANKKGKRLESIGFGIPGFTNMDGVVETTFGSIAFMENYPLKTIVEENFGLPCLLDNDARVVSLGEAMYGKGKGFERVLTLTLGTGVGLGFVVNGQFTEPLPLAHMGGHMKISDDEILCYCGKRGCLEALVSASGIRYLASQRRGLSGIENVEQVFGLASAGNEDAEWVVEKLVEYLHSGIHNYVNLFAPDIVILGGGISKSLSNKLTQIKGNSYMSAYPDYAFDLVLSELEEYAGILGSAALFFKYENNYV